MAERAKPARHKTEEESMDWNWVIYVLVGIAVGLNLGYLVGVKRGMMIMTQVIVGALDGVTGFVKKDDKG